MVSQKEKRTTFYEKEKHYRVCKGKHVPQAFYGL
jgi:hypothetical protein